MLKDFNTFKDLAAHFGCSLNTIYRRFHEFSVQHNLRVKRFSCRLLLITRSEALRFEELLDARGVALDAAADARHAVSASGVRLYSPQKRTRRGKAARKRPRRKVS